MGFRPATEFGLCLKTHRTMFIALLGVAHMGGVAVPLWTGRAPANENGRLIGGSRSQMCGCRIGCAINLKLCAVVPLDDEWLRAVANAKALDQPARDWNDPFLISATSEAPATPGSP